MLTFDVTRRVLPAALLALVSACAPASTTTGGESAAGSALTLTASSSQPAQVVLSAAHPSATFTFTCNATGGLQCSDNFYFGLVESTVLAAKPTVPVSTDGVSQNLFYGSQDGEKLFDFGWQNLSDGTSELLDSSGDLESPGSHTLTVTRESDLPADFPDLALNLTMSSEVVDCSGGDGCRPPGSAPMCAALYYACTTDADCCAGLVCGTDSSLCQTPGPQQGTISGTVVDAYDAQTVLPGMYMQLSPSGGGATPVLSTTSANDGTFSFTNVPFGEYTLLVNGVVIQSVDLTKTTLVLTVQD